MLLIILGLISVTSKQTLRMKVQRKDLAVVEATEKTFKTRQQKVQVDSAYYVFQMRKTGLYW